MHFPYIEMRNHPTHENHYAVQPRCRSTLHFSHSLTHTQPESILVCIHAMQCSARVRLESPNSPSSGSGRRRRLQIFNDFFLPALPRLANIFP